MVKIQFPKLVIDLQNKYSFLCLECYFYLGIYLSPRFPQKASPPPSQKD